MSDYKQEGINISEEIVTSNKSENDKEESKGLCLQSVTNGMSITNHNIAVTNNDNQLKHTNKNMQVVAHNLQDMQTHIDHVTSNIQISHKAQIRCSSCPHDSQCEHQVSLFLYS